ncbi:MAG: hypothetical protein KatS3mg085_834 [Candidatus Dojkabacteria bacterium]|nr:MAG: hypothetical protein KatS3mg085_834 [Candidatus Dojkabacteria bacterium]
MNIHTQNPKYPYHVSAGAVVLNSKNQVALQYFKHNAGHDNVYYLMRESLENNTTIEETLANGLMKEMGITAQIRHFVGSRVTTFLDADGNEITKTTIYYLCDLISVDESKKDPENPEGSSEVKFFDLSDAIKITQDQLKRTNYLDICEFDILQNVAKLI